jgi:hypothetical protein
MVIPSKPTAWKFGRAKGIIASLRDHFDGPLNTVQRCHGFVSKAQPVLVRCTSRPLRIAVVFKLPRYGLVGEEIDRGSFPRSRLAPISFSS